MLTHAELLRKAAGASATIAQVAGTIAAVDHRKSARGNRFAFVRLSDPTGLYEVRMFSDVLDAARDHLEPGRSVVLTVEATLEGDELKLLAKAAQPIDLAVAGAASDRPARLPRRRRRRDLARRPPRPPSARDAAARRRGPVNLVLMNAELPGEVEIALPEPYPMSPQVLGALKNASRRGARRGVLTRVNFLPRCANLVHALCMRCA